MRRLFLELGTAVAVAAWAASVLPASDTERPGAGADSNLARLADWMTGSFSSASQAGRDTNFLDIRLEMAPIWPDRTDGVWLYVEQAAAARLEQPYRQRVYRLTRTDDSTFRSDVYALPEPQRFAGAWREPGRLAALQPDSLELRDGCSIVLRSEGDSAFVGSTVGAACESTLRGASYATSEVRVTSEYLYSLDRGYDSLGQQVWGSEFGPYAFEKTAGPGAEQK